MNTVELFIRCLENEGVELRRFLEAEHERHADDPAVPMVPAMFEVARHGSWMWPGTDPATIVLADVKGGVPLAAIEVDEDQIEEVFRRARSALGAYTAEAGRVTFGMPLHCVVNVEDAV